jgi:hypothetical protein
MKRKSNIVIKFALFKNKQSLQIRILKELAISLVAFLVLANYLVGLIKLILVCKSI